MPNESAPYAREIQESFERYNRQVKIQNIRVGCVLGMILMPAGAILDLILLPSGEGLLLKFFWVRVACSVLIGVFWLVVRTPFGQRRYREFGVFLAMLPATSIAWMIYEHQGAASPYYAGLNLVLLVIGFVLQWTFAESAVAFSLVLTVYLVACFARRDADFPVSDFGGNLFFLSVTGIIMVTGNHYANRLRRREFSLRYELDRNREELEVTNERLRELDSVKSRFFANISHELRTPLTLLLAPLDSLIADKSHQFDAQATEWLHTMHSNGMRLLKLINDLLDLVKLESGRMELTPEPIALEEFVGGVCRSVKKVAEDKGLHVGFRVDAQIGAVLLDRDKLEKVLLNLIFNAIKFTPAGGRVHADGSLEDGRLVFEVQDTGMGISEEHQEHLFSRFWQADTSSQRKFQGAGLGLALVKELVEAQGGDVAVESETGRGTTFRFWLPYQPCSAAEAEAAASGSGADEDEAVARPHDYRPQSERREANPQWLQRLYRRAEMFPAMSPIHMNLSSGMDGPLRDKPTLLIADDEQDMLRFLRSQLSPFYTVLEAADGQQAIEQAQQYLPDVILSDMMMPEKDGLEVCEAIRAHTPTQNIPIVLLTARADEETKIKLLDAGANDFLPKPFSTTEVHLRLRNLVDSHRLERELAKQNRVLESTLEQLKDTETQLVQTEKLASLGRMSAGIIHEINNPLNYANTGMFMLKRIGESLPESDKEEFADTLKDIEDGIARIKTIVTDLRSFTRSDHDQYDSEPVEPIVESVLRFLSHELKADVEVRVDLPEGLEIWGNANQIVQVLLNLVQNASDAMRDKEYPEGEKASIAITGEEDEHRVFVAVRDNGPGLDSETVSKVFDPFFTTKEVGEGMGLGLSICYRIMEQHGGRIIVDSELGKFCQFKLEFPKRKQDRSEPIGV